MKRSTWYGLSTSTPAAGRTPSTETMTTSAETPMTARCLPGVPPMSSKDSAIAAYTRLVPKSRVSAAGSSTIRSSPSVVRQDETAWPRMTMKLAPTTAASTLPSSDAWKLKNPRFRDSVEPLTDWPSAATARIEAIMKP
ncbi:unannotated protein [freshwater metagenome]|uniref:Unannotated protein n=1 Tax=freshwater metagenome TaxID=449393 RepID=A0A6J7GRT4_9ZZZZ